MSIKIYKGFRFPLTNLETAFEQLLGMRAALKAKKADAIAHLLAKTLCEDADVRRTQKITGRLPTSETPLTFSQAFASLANASRDNVAENYRAPDTDFGMQVTLHPHGRDVLGIAFTEQNDWHSDLLDLPHVEEFNYWNNSDHSEHVSQEDWDCRGHTWAEVMSRDPDHRPGFAGLTLNLIATHPIRVPREQIIAAQPTLEQRTDALARDMLRYQAVKKIQSGDTSHIVKGILEANQQIETAAGQNHLFKNKSVLKAALPPRYSFNYFQGTTT